MNIIYKTNRDIYYFLILFILTVISVYYLPHFLNKFFFLSLLPIAYISKKNYLWIIYLATILTNPFRLFLDYSGEALYRIPQYDLMGIYGLTFTELLLIVLFIKGIFKGKKNKLILINYYYVFVILIIFLIVLSFAYGITTRNVIQYFRKFLVFTLFYTFPRLVKNKDFINMFKIFFIFSILSLIDQILAVTVNFSLADTVTRTHSLETLFIKSEFLRVSASGIGIFFTFIFGLVLYSMKRPFFNKRFLICIIAISYISIFMTGSRGWIIAFSVALIYYFIFIVKRKIRTFTSLIFIVLILSSILIFLPSVQKLLQSNVQRLVTIQQLAQGDLTAGGTLSRLNTRFLGVFDGVKQNPILGWGFSSTYEKYSDFHVGYLNQILQSGLIGLVIFIIFLFKFWNTNKFINAKILNNSPFKNSILALNLGIVTLVIIHFTSTEIFSFSLVDGIAVTVFIFFLLSDLWLKWALAENQSIKNKQIL